MQRRRPEQKMSEPVPTTITTAADYRAATETPAQLIPNSSTEGSGALQYISAAASLCLRCDVEVTFQRHFDVTTKGHRHEKSSEQSRNLRQMNRTVVFQAQQGTVLQAQTMLLDEPNERLYIGAKNRLLSLGLERINSDHKEIQWASTESQIEECLMKGREKPECANYIKVLQQYNHTHLLACGTGAFNPTCALVAVGTKATDRLFSLAEESVESGRGRCPYDPNSPCTSTLYRGELYIGVYTDYWENDGALCRLNSQTYTRTERDDRQQLNQPKFIKSAVIPDNDDREDDKVYFFFTEREQNPEGETKAVYTRVGRVCANDQGGRRMLVNRWSSFLKTRLICSVAGANGIDTHFDELEDIFVLKNKDEKNPEIFGLFSTTSAVFKGYAVCVYQMEDIRVSFNGPFAQRERPGHHWMPYEDRVPYPRPGSVSRPL
ncbi:Semaphorin-3E [Merluccius polli]|uniref:Semaphorin-3E n=1 Tax=Merluccius polli TaxID=89951 RepID=A0AA47P031_MERPO|nr:Semaphorin-3E [Merluccius polli]